MTIKFYAIWKWALKSAIHRGRSEHSNNMMKNLEGTIMLSTDGEVTCIQLTTPISKHFMDQI